MKNVIRLTESDLHRIIKESVEIILKEGEDSPLMVMIDGTLRKFRNSKEYKDYLKKLNAQKAKAQAIANGQEPPKVKRPRKPKNADDAIGEDQASPRGLAANVRKLVSDQTLASVKGFIRHGERQFGPNAIRTLVNMFKKVAGEDLFVKYNSIYNNISQTCSEIESWGRNNEYAVYERASKLANLLRDLNDTLLELSEAYTKLVQGNKIVSVFGNNANIIMGNGNSLGLKSLIFAKGAKAFSKVSNLLLTNADKLDEISKNGRDAFDYDPNDLRKKG